MNPTSRHWIESSFDNPEVAAMSVIAEILQQLPDDAARLRVMRWALGRFAPEVKRPMAPAPPQPAVPMGAPGPTTAAAPRRDDFGQQIFELTDLFPERDHVDMDAVTELWHA